MPDSLAQLYDTSRKLTKENKDILMNQATQDALNQREINKSPFLVPKLNLGQAPRETTSQYEGYISEPGMVTSSGNIDLMRAQNQSNWEQIGNTLIRAAADIPMQALGNLASMVDVEDYNNIDNEVGNGVTQLMTDWQEAWKEKNPIYRENPGKSFDIGDSGWWADNVSNLLDSAGGFVLTGYIAGGIIGKVAQGIKNGTMTPKAIAAIEDAVAEKVASGAITEAQIPQAINELKALHNASRLPMLDKMAGVTNAVALNQAESIMEGMGVYKDVFSQSVNEGKTMEDSHTRAADAAALDVNINRANILLNLTSASMFTKANKAVHDLYQVGKYGLKREFVGETIQEGLEEGVNYIAQQEAMQQAKDGENYQWDSARALKHLAEPQGLESMFLGAMGGAIQTGMTEGVISKGEDTKRTVEDVNKREKEKNPVTPTRQERQVKQNDYIYQYYQKKMAATSPEEHEAIDKEYLQASGPLAYVGGDLDTRLAEFDRLSKLTPDETVSQDEIDMAKKAVVELTNIKKVGDEVSLDEQKKGVPYENKEDLIRAKLAAQSAKQAVDVAENDLTQKSQETTDKKQLKPYEQAVADANKIYNAAEKVYADLVSDTTQSSIKDARKQKEAEDKAKAADEAAAKARAAKQESAAKPKAKAAGKFQFAKQDLEGEPAAVADHVHMIVDPSGAIDVLDKNASNDASAIDEQSLVDIAGDNKTAVIFKHKNGTTYQVLPALKRSVKGDDGQYRMTDTPPTITPIPDGLNGLPAVGAAIKNLFLINRNNPNMKINVGKSTFDFKDFVNWATNPNTKKGTITGAFAAEDVETYLEEGHPIKLSDINEFLKYTAAEDNSISEAGEIPDPITETTEPERPVDNMDVIDRDQQDSTKRLTPNAVNYLAEQYTIDIIKQTGDNKKYVISGTGVINREYLINADKTKVHAGVEVVLEPYDKIVPTLDYDAQGRSIIVDGQKKTTNHNAASALAADREIPIAIKIKATGEVIGFLPETKWLEEGTSGDRIHLKVEDPVATDNAIAAINAIRKEITDAYANNQKASVTTKILSTTPGVPILNSKGTQSLGKAMPKLDSDIKDYGQDYPFAYYSSGKVYGSDKTEISNIVNEQQLLSMNINDGSVIVLLPAGNGQLYGRVANSSRVADGDSAHIINGLMAAAGHTEYGKSARTYNESFAKTNGFKNIGTAEGLRQYLQQFIFMYKSDVLRDKNAREGIRAVVVTENKGAIKIQYGITQEGQGKTINLSEITYAFRSNDSATIKAAEAQLQELADFIGRMKTNFDITKVSSTTPVVGINKGGFTNVANNYLSRYMKTIQTNARSERSDAGKNVYLIQQTVVIDSDPKSTMTKSEKIESSGVTPSQVETSTQQAPSVPVIKVTEIKAGDKAELPTKAVKKNIGVADPSANIIPNKIIKEGDESKLASIGFDDSPLHDTELGSTEQQGEDLRAYCGKK